MYAIRSYYDQDRLEVTGSPRAVADNVGINALGVDVALSASGTLMYLTGTPGFSAQPVWIDRQGAMEPVDANWSFQSSSLYSTMALSPDGSRLIVSQEDESGQQLWVKELPRGPNAKLTFEGGRNNFV